MNPVLGNSLVLGWEETMENPTYQLHVGTLRALYETTAYDHVRVDPCPLVGNEVTIDMPAGDVYFLIVAEYDDGTITGFGRDSVGLERPGSRLGCRLLQVPYREVHVRASDVTSEAVLAGVHDLRLLR